MLKHTLIQRCAPLLAGVLLIACGKSPDGTAVVATDEKPASEAARSLVAAPATRIEAVEDVYHGQNVIDPYRWLEDWDDPEVQAWSDEQNAYARAALASLPERPAVQARLREILTSAQGVTYSSLRLAGKDTLFAIKRAPEKQQSILVAMGADADPASERVVIDPNQIDPSGGTSIDWYQPSHEGSLLAVSMSAGGSEIGNIHIYKIPSGEKTDIVIERVNQGTAGGDLAWLPDDSGFYYTRYPRPGERPDADLSFYQQVWQHTLGTPAEDDELILGEDFPRIAAIRLIVDPISGRLLVWLQNGDSGRFAMYLRQPGGEWDQFS